MKKLGALAVAVVLFISLAGCSGISKEEYQALADENARLGEQIVELEEQVTGQEELQNKNKELIADCMALQLYLTNVYDGYRKMVIQTTVAVAEGGLTMKEWEDIMVPISKEVYSYDDINAAMKDINEDLK